MTLGSAYVVAKKKALAFQMPSNVVIFLPNKKATAYYAIAFLSFARREPCF